MLSGHRHHIVRRQFGKMTKGQQMKIELVIKQDSLGFDVDIQPDADFLLLPDSVQDDILTEAQRAIGNLMIRDLANP